MVEQRQEFQRALEAIEAKVNGLFATVADGLPGATYAIVSGSNEVLGVLAKREQVIDALYREIDALASREILLQAPVASDLRFLLSVVRLVPELERSHDLVSRSRRGPIAHPVMIFHPSPGVWSSGWGTWRRSCGVRPPIPGGTATVLLRWR